MALPKDELELISKKLTFEPDYTRFRSVCKAWRSAAPKHPQIPWLIATDDDKLLNFYQISFETNKFTQIPELSKLSLLSSFKDNSNVFIRSSHGWLLLFNMYTSSVSLFNPLTNSIINLPNLQKCNYRAFRNGIKHRKFCFDLTSDPGEFLPDCFALICCSERILYCKVGCSDWIEMQHPEFYGCGNFHICCHTGKLFIAEAGDVFVCDFGEDPKVRRLVSFRLNNSIKGKFYYDESYLVESDGELLLVLVVDHNFKQISKVYKLEFGCQEVKLVKLNSLGDKALFLSLDTSVSLVARKYPGCKENSIYLPELSYNFEDRSIVQKMMVHEFDEDTHMFTTEDYYFPDNENRLRCAWFTPSLLM